MIKIGDSDNNNDNNENNRMLMVMMMIREIKAMIKIIINR